MTDVIWEEPRVIDRHHPRGGRLIALKDELRKNPGKWCRVGEYASSNTAQSTAGQFFRPLGFKTAVRGKVLYAMWPGDGA